MAIDHVWLSNTCNSQAWMDFQRVQVDICTSASKCNASGQETFLVRVKRKSFNSAHYNLILLTLLHMNGRSELIPDDWWCNLNIKMKLKWTRSGRKWEAWKKLWNSWWVMCYDRWRKIEALVSREKRNGSEWVGLNRESWIWISFFPLPLKPVFHLGVVECEVSLLEGIVAVWEGFREG